MAKQNKKQTDAKTVKEPTDEQLQGNQHDKIIKESIEEKIMRSGDASGARETATNAVVEFGCAGVKNSHSTTILP